MLLASLIAELMHDAYPGKLEMLYVHMVQPLSKTHGWDPERYRQKVRSCLVAHLLAGNMPIT